MEISATPPRRGRSVAPARTGSEEDRLAVRAVDLLQRVPDLVQRAVGPDAIEHRLDHVLVPAGGLGQALEGGADPGVVPPGAQLREPFPLPLLGGVVDLQDLDVRVLVPLGERVHADDDALAALDLPLLPLRAARDLPLEIAQLDAAHHAADP